MKSKKTILIILVLLVIVIAIYGIIKISKNDTMKTNEYPELRVQPDGQPNEQMLGNILEFQKKNNLMKKKGKFMKERVIDSSNNS